MLHAVPRPLTQHLAAAAEEEEVVAAVVVNASAAEMPAIRRTSIAVGRDNNKGHKNSLFI